MPSTKSPPTTPTILCIDDDPAIPTAIARRLAKYKVDVLTAFHGMQGIWMAMTEQPDVVITDVRMPQGEGDYVIESLNSRAETYDIPVVVLSGQRDSTTMQRMLALGAKHYLCKPARFEDLLKALRSCVEVREKSCA